MFPISGLSFALGPEQPAHIFTQGPFSSFTFLPERHLRKETLPRGLSPTQPPPPPAGAAGPLPETQPESQRTLSPLPQPSLPPLPLRQAIPGPDTCSGLSTSFSAPSARLQSLGYSTCRSHINQVTAGAYQASSGPATAHRVEAPLRPRAPGAPRNLPPATIRAPSPPRLCCGQPQPHRPPCPSQTPQPRGFRPTPRLFTGLTSFQTSGPSKNLGSPEESSLPEGVPPLLFSPCQLQAPDTRTVTVTLAHLSCG